MQSLFSVSTILVYGGFYAFVVFLSLGIACALYYLAELVEEYLKTTRRVLEQVVKATVVANLALFFDGLPTICIIVGCITQILYFRILKSKRFPYLEMSSPDVLLALVGFIANTGLWMKYFWNSRYTNEYVASFMLVTSWLVPSVLSLCLAGGESVLPGAGGYPYTMERSSSFSAEVRHDIRPSNSGKSNKGNKSRRSWALRMFEVLKGKTQDTISVVAEPHELKDTI
jgi:hypothetical protein